MKRMNQTYPMKNGIPLDGFSFFFTAKNTCCLFRFERICATHVVRVTIFFCQNRYKHALSVGFSIEGKITQYTDSEFNRFYCID